VPGPHDKGVALGTNLNYNTVTAQPAAGSLRRDGDKSGALWRNTDMLGTIAGDVIGSIYESAPTKSLAFPLFDPRSRFTDDTVLTVATAWAILRNKPFDLAYREFGRRYPNAGYGEGFRAWLHAPQPGPYRSFGNGSAMRVSPIGLAYDHETDVLQMAKQSAIVTHDHPEGVKGAQAVALAVFKARMGESKDAIREALASRFAYDLSSTTDEIRPTYGFDVSCHGSVPQAIVAFLDSNGVEHAIRLAVSLGGDSDTQAAIAGGIAHAFFREISAEIVSGVRERLPQEFVELIDEFAERYSVTT
jgi:ADP-ribosylglycohydrolase